MLRERDHSSSDLTLAAFGPCPTTPRLPRGRREESPPAAPRPYNQWPKEEVEEAIAAGCVPLLTVAISWRHKCGPTHPVHEAVSRKHLRALECLLANGCAPDDYCCGQRPLTLAVHSCMAEGDAGYQAIQLLLRFGARPGRLPGDLGRGPLHEAVARRSGGAAAALLLAAGADANEVDSTGDTALHILLKAMNKYYVYGHLLPPGLESLMGRSYQDGFVELLLRNGADPGRPGCEGAPAVDLVPSHDVRLAELLRRAARWRARTPFHVACANLRRDGGPVAGAGFRAPPDPRATCLGQQDVFANIAAFL